MLDSTSGLAEFETAQSRCGIRVVPNPTSGACQIVLLMPSPTASQIGVFDVQGQMVRRFELRRSPSERQVVFWDGKGEAGRELSSGIYLVRTIGSDVGMTGRLILVR